MFTIVFGIIFLIVCILIGKHFLDKGYGTEINSNEKINAKNLNSKEWWDEKRIQYNFGLILAGISAFLAYSFLGGFLIAPHDLNFEITLFTIFFQGIGYLFMILIANLFYNLGYFVERTLRKEDDPILRKKLFKLGFWGSVALPFLIPLLIIVEYFVRFY